MTRATINRVMDIKCGKYAGYILFIKKKTIHGWDKFM